MIDGLHKPYTSIYVGVQYEYNIYSHKLYTTIIRTLKIQARCAKQTNATQHICSHHAGIIRIRCRARHMRKNGSREAKAIIVSGMVNIARGRRVLAGTYSCIDESKAGQSMLPLTGRRVGVSRATISFSCTLFELETKIKTNKKLTIYILKHKKGENHTTHSRKFGLS